ncbi:MAG: hypothetical protein WCK09_06810 [Bacteroidota bacterium]
MFHQIHLSICKTLHGAFSQEYFFLFQRYKKTHPALKAGLKKCFSADPILRFENIIIRNNAFPVFKTSKPILFEKTEFGSDLKELVHVKGEADCVNFLKAGEAVIKIVGYRERIMNVSVLLLFYSSGERYFLGEYIFSPKEKSTWSQFANSIFKKYAVPDSEEHRQFYIEDEKGSILCFYDDGFSISIKFFNPAYCQPLDQLHSIFQQNIANNQHPGVDLSAHGFADRL